MFIETWKVVVPNRFLSGPSIWYWVTSCNFSGGMISQGISAPSTAFVDSACGRSGTGMVTGVAPISVTTSLPVGPGTRSFLPWVSATVRTGLLAIWIACPAWT